MSQLRKTPERDDAEKTVRLGPWATVCLVVMLGLITTFGAVLVINLFIGGAFFSWPTDATLTKERLTLIKVRLLVAGGLGGAVALTVAYRKQRWAEEDISGKRSAYTAAAAHLGDTSPTGLLHDQVTT